MPSPFCLLCRDFRFVGVPALAGPAAGSEGERDGSLHRTSGPAKAGTPTKERKSISWKFHILAARNCLHAQSPPTSPQTKPILTAKLFLFMTLT